MKVSKLLDLMSDISERCYCAQWLSDLEFDLWKIILDYRCGKIKGNVSYGQSEVTIEEIKELVKLSEESNGWWAWIEGDYETISGKRQMTKLYGNVFIELYTWNRYFNGKMAMEETD